MQCRPDIRSAKWQHESECRPDIRKAKWQHEFGVPTGHSEDKMAARIADEGMHAMNGHGLHNATWDAQDDGMHAMNGCLLACLFVYT